MLAGHNNLPWLFCSIQLFILGLWVIDSSCHTCGVPAEDEYSVKITVPFRRDYGVFS
jgi:hypothetical protein